MAKDDNGAEHVPAADSSSVVRAGTPAGTAVVARNSLENPGFPPHRPRITDLNPKEERKAERTVYTLFYVSIVGSVFAIAAYMAFPITAEDPGSVRLNNLFIGLGLSLALFAIGIGAVHWGKALMSDHEGVDERHPVRGTDEVRARAVEIFQQANEESGFGRRTLIRNSLIGALIAFPLPAVVLFRGLGPQDQDPVELLRETLWKTGTRLALDPSGTPIKASDLTLGSSFHVIPEGLAEMGHGRLEEKAKAAVLLMRLKPEQLVETPERKDWSYQGIVAYSKICTHVGCPVALYEQQTHHLLCPCHQSQFDVTNHCEVIFGPAARPLPQLPITVDAEGYLIAQSDFTEPVGPSFWERK
ncbi:ubiquinol-cytochrome c reductase iron-sulfur subunit [Cryobacterium psychrophilum]|uniref:Cytochrome bc1 complex Rieske iron-sulfur subunit n=1 Tax=Cryobacterium psychrophilum TaxID=41988 RepID=A0A4Y8KR20_9MICO|nr:Rieske 2Fe-2S domain-containing protein [Cryobacterium psychrophilum]TDW28494.1 menaquinol-cytochrome c reductase iron-sulfur subunit precursor [Cryobacterium psychrophilum]TFD80502.1 ubiquinol-cytochrome C reductase [Cryobacterium psychrophilum]